MKNASYLIVLLSLGLLFVSYRWAVSEKPEAGEARQQTSSISDIMTRASVRSYSSRPVSEGCVDTLLRAAMAAPTAGNKQPWRFVVLRDRQTLDRIGEDFKSMSMMKKAAVAIVVCGDTTATFPGEGREYWVQDASAATENLLLAAHALGLGAVWCGVYPLSERVAALSDMLGLPSGIIPLNCIAIGYPEGDTEPKDKWKPEYIHYERWGYREASGL